MREDGDIDKEYFRERKKEIEISMETLQREIQMLSPKPILQKKTDYQTVLADLKKRLEAYVGCEEKKIPESVIEAFVEKIWVSKDEFRWYLRYDEKDENNNGLPENIKIASFTINLEDAKKYIYSFSTKKRVYNWCDLNVSVWV